MPYGYGRLVAECARRGIGRNLAFKLAREKKLETFQLGKSRFVKIDSLESLPDRLAADQGVAE